ncbi:hypothetical protein [Alienimonas californiensis]|uniref:Cytochrome c domain-containing protein n=1 Tax=Alienimonas californiensis TaxID=2527989 RepID=A0A517P4Y9_9PLAN|nr:hypothetical protein [Alienimonas californiensis]QDT14415.1 hypothetical protein CA12_04880 [Alienimonas californiensis]
MSRRSWTSRTYWAAVLAVAFVTPAATAQRDDYSGPPISYETAEVDDPVARLSRQLEAGEIELTFDAEHGYLKGLLTALDVPESSQTLVFSKTSMQRNLISPRTPRALYFNDDVYVGFCQGGGVLELAATDAQQGATFYTLEQSAAEPPRLVRDRGHCLTCHASTRTQDVPGYLVRSVFVSAGGQPEFGSGTFTTDHASPFEERWGGWYVTGTHGDMRHMGNALYQRREGDVDREAGANVTSLEGRVATTPYLTPHSDLVALMVLEHQTQMHNALAWANYETRRALHQSQVMNEALDRPADYLSPTSERRIDAAADRVLEYLLFRDEFPLTSPVAGTSAFTTEFQARGVRDSQGRSLRDFDLDTRLFRHPCSYLIHSAAFDGLPDVVRGRVLTKLKSILQGGAAAEDYPRLTPADHRALREILTETKPEFAALE